MKKNIKLKFKIILKFVQIVFPQTVYCTAQIDFAQMVGHHIYI